MNDPEEPLSTYRPATEKPATVYEGKAAIVTLFSWGTERSPAYTLRIVKLIKGRRTCGRTFVAGSFDDLLREARGEVGRDQSSLEDVERCLIQAGWQLAMPTLDETP